MAKRIASATIAFLSVALADPTGYAARSTPDSCNSELVRGERAVRAVRVQEGIPSGEFLRAVRAGVYDEPFQPSWHAPVGFEAYLIRDSGIETALDGRPRFHTSTGPHEILVLLHLKPDKAYLLRGSKDPLRGFNDLVHALGLKCGSNDAVLRLLWIFADIAGGYASQIVQSPHQARWAVEGYRLRQSGDAGLETAIAGWWSSNEKSLNQVRPPTVQQEGDVYRVLFYLARGGSVARQKLDVGKDCVVGASSIELITTELAPTNAMADGGSRPGHAQRD